MSYQDEYGITARIRTIIKHIPSWTKLIWIKDVLRQAHGANLVGEFIVSYNRSLEGHSAHMDLTEILELCCPGCFWETFQNDEENDVVFLKVSFNPGTMEIPREFQGLDF